MLMIYSSCRSELMYTKCIQNDCIQIVSHISTNVCIHFVYKMYTKCFHRKCVPHFYKFLYTKCIQNVCILNVYHLSTKFLTSWHSSYDFVYKMYTKVCRNVVYILYTFCIHQLYISCILCNFCIQNVYTFSVWDAFPFQKGLFSPFSLARNRIYLGTYLKEELTNLL